MVKTENQKKQAEEECNNECEGCKNSVHLFIGKEGADRPATESSY